MTTIAALFDCDGTLYSAQYGRGLMKYSSENGRKGSARAYFASLILPYFLRKCHLIGDETYHRPVISRLAWMAKGMTELEFQKTSEWIINDYLLPTERREVITHLREHQLKGHVILLVSGMPTPSLDLLGAHYNVNGIIGTKLELIEGRFTGRIIPPVITGHDKGLYSREFFFSRNIEVDWGASYAYADSITDAGLFDLVGHPIAVNPDEKLLDLARSKKWEILGNP